MEDSVREELKEIKVILRGVAESQAAAEVRMDRADARMDRADARMDRAEARTAQSDARFEKRMRGFEKLVRIGMTELRRMEKTFQRRAAEQDEKINILIQSQHEIQASLKAFLDSMRRGGNGHRGGRAR